MNQESLAHEMYDAYCHAVGGKAFNGDPLPTSEEFFADDSKQKQADAWRVAAQTAIKLQEVPERFDTSSVEGEVKSDKAARRDLDAQLQRIKELPPSRERSLAITKLQEAIMWLGMDLKRLNEPNPYPESKNPENTKIEPTADGLKL